MNHDLEALSPSGEAGGTFAPEEQPPRKQSKLGVASFIIGLASIIAFIICMVFFTISIMDYITKDGKLGADPQTFLANASLVVSLLCMFASICAGFVGLILGIVGACMRNTRKAFAVIGIVLNGLLVVGFAGLFIFGLVMRASGGTA